MYLVFRKQILTRREVIIFQVWRRVKRSCIGLLPEPQPQHSRHHWPKCSRVFDNVTPAWVGLYIMCPNTLLCDVNIHVHLVVGKLETYMKKSRTFPCINWTDIIFYMSCLYMRKHRAKGRSNWIQSWIQLLTNYKMKVRSILSYWYMFHILLISVY